MTDSVTNPNYLPPTFRKNSLVKTTIVRQPRDTWAYLVRKKCRLNLLEILSDNRPRAATDLYRLSREEWNEKYATEIIKWQKLRSMVKEDKIITLFDLLAFSDFTKTNINISFTPRVDPNQMINHHSV